MRRRRRRRSGRSTRSASARRAENELVTRTGRCALVAARSRRARRADRRRARRDRGTRPARRWGRCGTDGRRALLVRVAKPAVRGGPAPRGDSSSPAGSCATSSRACTSPDEPRRTLPTRCSRLPTERAPSSRARGRRLAVRYPHAGRARNHLLRALTTFAALFVPAALREAVSDAAWLRGDARGRARARARRAGDRSVDDAAFASVADASTSRRSARRAAPPATRSSRSSARCAPRRRRAASRPPRRDEPGRRSTRRRCSSPATRSRLILAELDGAEAACARLAETHRVAPMAARTLLQQAVPTTFGYKAAGWLVGPARRARAAARARAIRRSSAARPARSPRFGDRGLERRSPLRRRARPRRASSCPGTPTARRSPSSPPRWTRAARAAKIGARRRAARADRGGRGRRGLPAAGRRRCRTSGTRRAPSLARACARLARASAGVLTGGRARARACGGRLAGGVARALLDARVRRRRRRGDARVPRRARGRHASGCARTSSDDLYAEQRALGLDGDYLGAAEALRRPRARRGTGREHARAPRRARHDDDDLEGAARGDSRTRSRSTCPARRRAGPGRRCADDRRPSARRCSSGCRRGSRSAASRSGGAWSACGSPSNAPERVERLVLACTGAKLGDARRLRSARGARAARGGRRRRRGCARPLVHARVPRVARGAGDPRRARDDAARGLRGVLRGGRRVRLPRRAARGSPRRRSRSSASEDAVDAAGRARDARRRASPACASSRSRDAAHLANVEQPRGLHRPT